MSQPLGMPEGSVRAIITILLVVGFLGTVAYQMYGQANGNPIEINQVLLGVMGVVVGYYFGSRQGESVAKAPDGTVA